MYYWWFEFEMALSVAFPAAAAFCAGYLSLKRGTHSDAAMACGFALWTAIALLALLFPATVSLDDMGNELRRTEALISWPLQSLLHLISWTLILLGLVGKVWTARATDDEDTDLAPAQEWE